MRQVRPGAPEAEGDMRMLLNREDAAQAKTRNRDSALSRTRTQTIWGVALTAAVLLAIALTLLRLAAM